MMSITDIIQQTAAIVGEALIGSTVADLHLETSHSLRGMTTFELTGEVDRELTYIRAYVRDESVRLVRVRWSRVSSNGELTVRVAYIRSGGEVRWVVKSVVA